MPLVNREITSENSDTRTLPVRSSSRRCSWPSSPEVRENLEPLKVLEFKLHIHFGIWRLRQAVAEVGPDGEVPERCGGWWRAF